MKLETRTKPLHIAFSDVTKGGSIVAFGTDVSAKERRDFKQIIHVAFISVVALFMFLVADLCLVLLHVTGKADTISFSLEGTSPKVVVGTGIALMVWSVAWVLIQFWRKPHKSPKEVLRKASEGVRWHGEKAKTKTIVDSNADADADADADEDLEQGQGEREGGEEEKDGEAETEAGAELLPFKPPPSAKKNAVMPLLAD